MAKANTDKQTLDLIELVKKQKAEIAKAERPSWKTNRSFSYVEGSSQVVNLAVESSVKNLISIAAFLMNKEIDYAAAATVLGVEKPEPFTWGGYPVSEWMDDIKLRIAKIQIESKKKRLELLESRLNAVISPELKAKMELDAIASELN